MKPAVGLLTILLVARLAYSTCPSECRCDGNVVSCSSLGFTQIPQNLPHDSVVSLDLSSNEIKSVEKDTLLKFTKLNTLYLSYNEIAYINVDAFAKLQDLVEIDLSSNNLVFIDPEVFTNNRRLEVVILSGNPLSQIPKDFPLLISSTIRSLDLSHCSLDIIYPKTFSRVNNLDILDLSYNRLERLSQRELNGLTHLKQVELGNNRWSCRCETKELIQWANSLRVNTPPHKPINCKHGNETRKLWSVTDQDESCIKDLDENMDQQGNYEDDLTFLEESQEYKDTAPVPNDVVQEYYEYDPLNSDFVEEEDSDYPELEIVVKKKTNSKWIYSWNIESLLVFVLAPIILGMCLFIILVACEKIFKKKLPKNLEYTSTVKKNIELQPLSTRIVKEKPGTAVNMYKEIGLGDRTVDV